MKPSAIIVFLVLAMLTSQAFSWGWSRRRRRSTGSRFVEISTLTVMMMIATTTIILSLICTIINKPCFVMLVLHVCPIEFPQNVKCESLNVNQIKINLDMKISIQKNFPLLNLYLHECM